MTPTTRELLLQIVSQETQQNGACVALWSEADANAGYAVRADGQVMGMGEYQYLEAGQVGTLDDVARRDLGMVAGCMVPWQRAEIEQHWAFDEDFVAWAGGRGEGYGVRPIWVSVGTVESGESRCFSLRVVRMVQDISFDQNGDVRTLAADTLVNGSSTSLGTILLFVEGSEKGWALAVPKDWVASAASGVTAPVPAWLKGSDESA